MQALKIKQQFKKNVVSFENYSGPIGKASAIQLLNFAILASESKDQSVLRFFEKVPALDVMKQKKTDLELGVPDVDDTPVAPVVPPVESSEMNTFKGKSPKERNKKQPAQTATV